MLSSLRLERFKSFLNQEVELGPLTLLVGANGSGKSNFFDAIRFLHGVGLGMSLTDVLRGRWEGGRQIWPGIRGGVADAATQPGARSRKRERRRRGGIRSGKSFDLHGTWLLPEQEAIRHTIGCELSQHVTLARESLSSSRVPGYLFDTHAPTLGSSAGPDAGSVRVALKRSGKGKNVVQNHDAHRSLLDQIRPLPTVNGEVGRVCTALRTTLRSALFLDIAPARMRDYVPRQSDVLGTEGENLSALVWQLCQDQDQKQELIDWLTELCAPELEDIDFVETELGDVMLVFEERDGRRIPARSLSDGTLRFLGELMALRTAPEGSLLLIEEIENGLHPTRAHLLVEALESATEHRGIQVIATTHAPLILQALTSETLADAVVMARVPDEPGTVMRRLGDLPHFEEVSESSDIERLFTTGWLERAL